MKEALSFNHQAFRTNGTNTANGSFLSSGLQEFLLQVIASLIDITPGELQLYKSCIDICGWFPSFLVFIHILNVPSFLEGNTSLAHVGKCE